MVGIIKQMSVSAAPWLDGVVSQSTILDNEGAADLICLHMNPDRSYELYYLDYADEVKQVVEVIVAEVQTAVPLTIPDLMEVHGTFYAGLTQYVVLKSWIPITGEEDLR